MLDDLVKVYIGSFTFARVPHSCTFLNDIQALSLKSGECDTAAIVVTMWNAIASIFRH